LTDYSLKDLKNALIRVGLKKGDNILCHSNIGYFGRVKGIKNSEQLCKAFLKVILSIIKKKGTFIVPTFSYSFFYKKNFEIKKTKSKMGIFSEYIRKHPKSTRSLDPNFSVSALGYHSQYFSEVNTENTYSEESFFDKFHKQNGKILDFNFIGSTIIHYYERKLNVPYRFDKNFYGLIDSNKKKRFVFSRKLGDKKNIHDALPKKKLIKKKKILKLSKLGRGEITCVTSHDFFKYIKKEYKKNRFILTENHRYKK